MDPKPNPLRAISLHQPWASLVAEGIKQVETRGWATKYRGPIVIHAAQRTPEVWSVAGIGWVPELERRFCRERRYLWLDHKPGLEGECLACRPDQAAPIAGWTPNGKGHAPVEHTVTLPLGTVVAVCELVDVVPIQSWSGTLRGPIQWAALAYRTPGVPSVLVRDHTEVPPVPLGTPGVRDILNQVPLGDFTPGRYAWLLNNIRKLPEPIPVRGFQRLWSLPDNVDAKVHAAVEGL